MRWAIRRLPTLSFEDMGTRGHYSTVWGKSDLVAEEWQADCSVLPTWLCRCHALGMGARLFGMLERVWPIIICGPDTIPYPTTMLYDLLHAQYKD
jgi:hypothetical protein